MRNVMCEQCGRELTMNETWKIFGKTLCSECAEPSLAKRESIPAEQIQGQVDPTVCFSCGLDNGDADLPRLAELPVCSKCEEFFRNRPFPGWLRTAVGGMVVLVVLSLVWNARFIRAYYEMRRGGSALATRNLESAVAYLDSASRRVPESSQLRTYSSFCKGVLLLTQDKSAEALKVLQSCRHNMPAQSGIGELIIQAEIGVAFDNGDYDKFLTLAQRLSSSHNDDPSYAGQVASAYACKYAETGNEEFKAKSLAALDRARSASEQGPTFAEYEDRILYRLHTREVINRRTFKERFPNGWKRQGKD